MRPIGFAVMSVFVLSSCMDVQSLKRFVGESQEVSTVDAPEYYEAPPEHLKQSYIKVVSSEDLLDADGKWHVVEQGRDLDPAKAHLAARNRVNTKRRKRMADLTAHFEPDAKSGEDGKLRIIKIEATDEVPEFETASVSSKPVKIAQDRAFENFGRGRTPFHGLKAFFSGGHSKLPRPSHKPSLSLVDNQVEVDALIIPPDLPDFRKPPSALVDASETMIVPKRKPRVNESQVHLKIASAVPLKTRVASSLNVGGYAKAIKMRSGRHPGRTRFVIEVSKITKYKVAIDSIRNVLRIKMDDTEWAMKPQGRLSGSRLLGTYIARSHSDGSVLLEVRLSEKTKVLGTLVLPPNDSAKHRVVIDLDH